MSKPILTPANGTPAAAPHLPTPAFDSPAHHLRLYQGDCLEILAAIPASSVDLVFADLPAAGGSPLLPLQRRHHLPRPQNGAWPAQKRWRYSQMTTPHAIKVVQEIVNANRENEELEGILNRHRIAALNHVLAIAKTNDERPQTAILVFNPPA